ncbi:alkaline phosphatase [Massilia eurypsychrophila]|uniref:histidine kinase n=2 Tax=Massilia eurypsychrophila TaxID=1485217 RepID=A0A2G8T7L0_9BURK|nr:diguanylate cyclase [Massilia eurypsychrophila]PIL41953.1 alkaline phosphatase [Massilia eurypsychrophila]
MDSERQLELVEANENLVMAMLQAHSERDASEKRLRDMALSAGLDALTGLSSRVVLLDRFRHAIVKSKRRGERLALLFLDLNKFKHINDTFGHATGDQVLKIAARCFTAASRKSDTVCRYGGDEFVILLEEISEVSDVVAVVEKIISSLSIPDRVGPYAIRLTASIGISLYPDNGDEAEMLIALADKAMYAAKRIGNGKFIFAGKTISQEILGTHLLPPLMPHQILLVEKDQREKHRRSADEQLANSTLTAQELRAGAEQALRRQTEFLALLAHELRNPLGSLRNVLSVLKQAPPEAAIEIKAQGIIDRQVVHMTKLLDDVLDMSRISTGKMRLERTLVDIVGVIGQVIETTQTSIGERRQILCCDLPDFTVEILADPIRLNQIFGNLLDNASKYTPEEKTIELAVEINETSVIVKITDTGIGITAEALPNVFNMFVQDSHATRFNGKGLGIGLALVKELVEAHGGLVTANSDGRGLGSQFIVTLPRQLGGSPNSQIADRVLSRSGCLEKSEFPKNPTFRRYS